MRLITGDECGLLKECIPELTRPKKTDSQTFSDPGKVVAKDEGSIRLDNNFRPTRRRGVVDLDWLEPENDNKFASLRIDGSLELWERSVHDKQSFGRYRQVSEISNIFLAKSAGKEDGEGIHPFTRPLALSSLTSNDKRRLCACDAKGQVVVVNPYSDDQPVVRRFSGYEMADNQEKQQYPIVSAMALDTLSNRVALGGKDRETVLWDLESAKQVWKAKNLPPDPQTLLQPLVWPTAILFMDADQSIGSNVMAVGTAHHQVRIYDIREDSMQRRPISYTPDGLLEHRVTALCQVDPYNLVVGDAAGYLQAIDLRKLGKQTKAPAIAKEGRFVGPAGSVRMLAKHPSLPRMAAVGLDRMLRIYDTTKRKQVSCFYLKQRLNCVLMGEEGTWGEDGEDFDDSDIDQDDIVRDYVDSDDEDDDSGQQQEENVSDGSHEGGRVEDGDSESEDDDSGSEEGDEMAPRKRQKQ